MSTPIEQALGIVRTIVSAEPPPGRSKWDVVVFGSLRKEPAKVLTLEFKSEEGAIKAVKELYALNLKPWRKVSGLRISKKRKSVTVWIDEDYVRPSLARNETIETEDPERVQKLLAASEVIRINGNRSR